MPETGGEPLQLNCLIEGESAIFGVEVPSSAKVMDLKKAIKTEREEGTLKGVGSHGLVLWKVDKAVENLTESQVTALRGKNGEELWDGLSLVSTYWPATVQVLPNLLHIIVELPSDYPLFSLIFASLYWILSFLRKLCGISSDRPRLATPHLAPRLNTVEALYTLLSERKYVQVRGTPASGKSCLSLLLINYIENKEPRADIIRVTSWYQEGDHVRSAEEWLGNKGWNYQNGGVLVIDEAQSSYWDKNFWNDLKDIGQNTRYRIITFSSYGTDGNDPRADTPGISPACIVGLRPNTMHQPPVALLLTADEFAEFVAVTFPDHLLEKSLLDSIFCLANGHVGTCKDLINIISAHDSYRRIKGKAGASYSFRDFLSNITMSHLVQRVNDGQGVSRRGLPQRYHMSDPKIADVFRKLSREGISLPKDTFPMGELHKCIRSGWLSPEFSKPSDPNVKYDFPSKWHQRVVECLLYGEAGHIAESSIRDFAIGVISKFSPRNIKERDFGSSTQTIPESQLQQEFYRASFAHTNGSSLSFPEFGNERGKVDFYTPSKRWAIALLRDGDRINDHILRFTKGEYSEWIKDGIIGDYIILDFCKSVPRVRCDVQNLYYVISTDEWCSAEIRDHNQDIVQQTFNLLH